MSRSLIKHIKLRGAAALGSEQVIDLPQETCWMQPQQAEPHPQPWLPWPFLGKKSEYARFSKYQTVSAVLHPCFKHGRLSRLGNLQIARKANPTRRGAGQWASAWSTCSGCSEAWWWYNSPAPSVANGRHEPKPAFWWRIFFRTPGTVASSRGDHTQLIPWCQFRILATAGTCKDHFAGHWKKNEPRRTKEFLAVLRETY